MSLDSASTPIAANIAASLKKLREVVLGRYNEFKLALATYGETMPEVEELVKECAAAVGDGVLMLMDMLGTSSYEYALEFIGRKGAYGRYFGTVMVESKAAATRNFDIALNECCRIYIGGQERSPKTDSFAANRMGSALYTLLFSTLYDVVSDVIDPSDLESIRGTALGAAFVAVSGDRLQWMRACMKVATDAATAVTAATVDTSTSKRARSVESESQSPLLQEMLQNSHQMCITSIGNKLSDYAGLVASFL